MIHRYLFEKLTEDDWAIILYVLNVFENPGFGIEIDSDTICSYKYRNLAEILIRHMDKVKDYNRQKYIEILEKLNIRLLDEKPKENTAPKEDGQTNNDPPASLGTGEKV